MREWTSNPGRPGPDTGSGRRLLTIKEAANFLGCTPANVYALRQAGQLPFVPIGTRKGYRVDQIDLDAFIERRKERRDAAEPKLPRSRLKHLRLP